MNGNLDASKEVAVIGAIDPDVLTAGAHVSSWVDMQDFFRIMAIVAAGTLGASATLDAKFEQATDGSGTGAKDVTGTDITQLTQAGGDSDKQAVINLRQNDLDFANDFRFVRLSITVATATSDAAGVLLGLSPRDGSADANDAASVTEIVN